MFFRLSIHILLFIGLFFTSSLALGSEYELQPGIKVTFEEPVSPWQINKNPPEFLVRERAAHLHEPQLEAARKAGLKTPEEAATRMLQVNELFMFNPQTGAHLEIDFSPLRDGESPPVPGTLEASAKFAAEGLDAEEGIELLDSKVSEVHIGGAEHAFRVDADYRRHGKSVRFIGIVTFAQGNWVFLYYTGPEQSKDDLAVVNDILSKVTIAPRSP